jgi:hypothetical protein
MGLHVKDKIQYTHAVYNTGVQEAHMFLLSMSICELLRSTSYWSVRMSVMKLLLYIAGQLALKAVRYTFHSVNSLYQTTI